MKLSDKIKWHVASDEIKDKFHMRVIQDSILSMIEILEEELEKPKYACQQCGLITDKIYKYEVYQIRCSCGPRCLSSAVNHFSVSDPELISKNLCKECFNLKTKSKQE